MKAFISFCTSKGIWQYLVSFGLFFFGLLVISSDKQFFVVCVVFFFSQFLLSKGNIIKTLLLTFIPFFLFSHIGQWYGEVAIPGDVLTHVDKFQGRMVGYTFSPYSMWSVVALGITPLIVFFNKHGRSLTLVGILCLMIVLFISVSLSSNPNGYAYGRVLNDISPVFLLVSVYAARQRFTKSDIHSLLLVIFFQIIILAFFEIGIGLLQLVFGSAVPFHIVQNPKVEYEARGFDEIVTMVRPSGSRLHPNILTGLMVEFSVSLVAIGLYLKESLKDKYFSNLFYFINWLYFPALILLIILLQSRVGYILLVITLGILLVTNTFNFSQIAHKCFKRFFNISPVRKLQIYVVLSVLLFIFVFRLLSSLYSFSPGGGLTFRVEMLQEAVQVIQGNPLWGTGPSMYIKELYKTVPDGHVLDFPVEVHNQFVLIIAEYGIVSSMILFGLLLGVLKKLLSSSINNRTRTVLVYGFFLNAVILNLHLFLYLLTINVITAVLLLIMHKEHHAK